MPQLVPLVLTDRASPAVDHTFNPRDITAGVSTLSESSGVPIGDSRVTASLVRGSTGRIKATLKFTIPVVQDQVINGVTVPTVARTNYADVTFNFADTSSTQERNNLEAFVADALGSDQPMIHGMIVDLQGLY